MEKCGCIGKSMFVSHSHSHKVRVLTSGMIKGRRVRVLTSGMIMGHRVCMLTLGMIKGEKRLLVSYLN